MTNIFPMDLDVLFYTSRLSVQTHCLKRPPLLGIPHICFKGTNLDFVITINGQRLLRETGSYLIINAINTKL